MSKQVDLFHDAPAAVKPVPKEPAWRRVEAATPEPVAPSVLSVSQLTLQLKGLLEPRFTRVWVRGEVSNFRGVNARGHLYFCLKDAQSSIDVKVWASTAARLKFQLKEGLSLIIEGSINVYEPQGRYSLIGNRLEPEGVGAQALALEQLKKKLVSEGLIGDKRIRPLRSLPFLPRRIGVVTSVSGAALKDFLKVLHRRHPRLSVLVADARMQGESASAEVRRALRWLARAAVDVVVITRGGGSVDDLSTFNDELVVRAVWDCPVPVVSAVGHEIDTTLCDLVADVRAPTPSAAAELLAPSLRELEAQLATWNARLFKAVERLLISRRAQLNGWRLRLEDPRRLLSAQRLHITALAERLSKSHGLRQRRSQERLHGLLLRLQRARPQAQMAARRERLHQLKQLLRSRFPLRVQRERQRVDALHLRLVRQTPAAAVRHGRHVISGQKSRVVLAAKSVVERQREYLRTLAAQLDALSPLAVLARGYALVQRPDGQLVRRATEVQVGQSLRVRLSLGELIVDVAGMNTASK